MSFHSEQTAIHRIHNYTFDDAADRIAGIESGNTVATDFESGDIGKVAHQTDLDTFWVLISTAPIWKELSDVGGGGGDHTSVSTNAVPVNSGSQVYIDSGATVDLGGTNEWTFNQSINVPGGSAKFGETLKLSEGGDQLVIADLLEAQMGFAVTSDFTDATGSSRPNYIDFGVPQTFNFNLDDSVSITANPLSFSIPISIDPVTDFQLTDRITLRTGAAMTNFRAKLTDNATGLVIRYIPNKAAWEGDIIGISLAAGDNTFFLGDEGTDTASLHYLGYVPIINTHGQTIDVEFLADAMNILGDATGDPYMIVEIHTGPKRELGLDEFANRLQTTGILEGGVISTPSSTRVSWTSGRGQVVDYADPENPVISELEWDAVDNYGPVNLATDDITAFGYDSNGDLVEKLVSELSIADYHTTVFIGTARHLSTVIESVSPAPRNLAYDGTGSFADFINVIIGPANVDGNVYGPNGVNMTMDVLGGNAYMIGSNFRTDSSLSDIVTLASGTAIDFFKVYQSSGVGTNVLYDGAATTIIDPSQYDDGSGTLQVVTNNSWTIQRIFRDRDGSTYVAYGQEEFGSKSTAIDALGSESFLEKSPLDSSLFRAFLLVQEGAVDLSDTAEAEFFVASSFRVSGAQSSGATIPGITSPGGSNTNVQFNDGGTFGGDPNFYYFTTTDVTELNLKVPSAIGQATLNFRDFSGGLDALLRLDEPNNVIKLLTLTGTDINLSPAAGNHVGISIDDPVSCLHVYENTALTDSTTGITIEQDGVGDAIFQWLLTGGKRWVAGIDNSDSDKWKLSGSTDVGVDPIITVDDSVDAAGHVGIGTASPTSTLHVLSNSADASDGVKVEQSGAGDAALHFDVTGLYDWIVGIDQSDDGHFKIVPSTSLGIGSPSIAADPDGHVGIGIGVPSSKLHVYNNDALTSFVVGLMIEQDGAGDAAAHFSVAAQDWSIGIDNSDSDMFKISAANSLGTSDILNIDPAGFVGVNKDVPTSPLVVYEDNATKGSTNGIVIEQDGTGNATLQWLTTGVARWAAGLDNTGAKPTTDWVLAVDGSFADAERAITVDAAKQVVVGPFPAASTASKQFTVYGDNTSSVNALIQNAGTGDAVLEWLVPGLRWSAGIDNSDGDKWMLSPSNGLADAILTVTTDDKVGINTLDPATALNVHSRDASENYLRMTSPGAAALTGLQIENTGAGIDLELYYNQATDRSYLIDRSASGLEVEATAGVLFLKSSTDDILLDVSSNAGRIEILGLNHTAVHSIFNIANQDGDVDFYVGEDTPVGNVSAVGGAVYFRDNEAASGLFIKKSTGAASTADWAEVGDIVGPASSVDNALATFDGTTGKLLQQSSGITSITTATEAELALTAQGPTGGAAIEFYDNASAIKLSIIHNDNTDANLIISDVELSISVIGAALDITAGDDITIDANAGANLITLNTNYVFSDITTDAILEITTPTATGKAALRFESSAAADKVQFEYDQNTDVASIDLFTDIPLSITGVDHEDLDILLTLATQNTNGGQSDFFVGDRTPVANVTANPGSFYIRQGGTSSELYFHKGASANNADWQRNVVANTDEAIEFVGTSVSANIPGQVYYDSTDRSLSVSQGDGVTANLGKETFVPPRVRNDQGVAITNSQAVYITGSDGTYPDVQLAQADAEATAGVIGLITQTSIANGALGWCTTYGLVRDFDTQTPGWAAGDVLYLSATAAGGLTNVAPTFPNFVTRIGTVITVGTTTGSVFVNHPSKEEATGSTPVTKSYAVGDYGTADVNYVAGFYEYSIDEVVLTIGGTVDQVFGDANRALNAHAFVVIGSTTTSGCTLTVHGTSITSAGVRTTLDSEVIIADTDGVSVNEYYETTKKWLGDVTFTLTGTSGALDFNYGVAKYEDFGNSAFTVTEFEAVGKSSANDADTDIILWHHSSAGWTYNAGAFKPEPTKICSMGDDYDTDDNIDSDTYFSYKRTNLDESIDGTALECVIIEFDIPNNNSLWYANFQIGVFL